MCNVVLSIKTRVNCVRNATQSSLIMSEPKRATFNTISIVSEPSSSSSLLPAACKTFRFDLNLFEPNADSFTEFNYSKLLQIEKKKRKKISKSNGFSDPFEETDDDVTRIAKEFERKYGNAYAGKNSNVHRSADYCDKGAGYDENDDFIDNTEAYDEIIPDEVEANMGGFYINSGALEFKQLSNFERPDDALRMPKARKRALSTSSESSASSETETDKKSLLKNGQQLEKKAKVSNVTTATITTTATTITTNNNSTNDKEAVKGLSNKDKKLEKFKAKEKKDDGAGSDSGKDSSKKVIKTTTVKDMLRAKRDNMRNMVDGGSSSGNGHKSENTEDSGDRDADSSDDSEESSDEDRCDAEPKPDPSNGIVGEFSDIKLPDNLSVDLLMNINKISKATLTAGKNNFFDATNMELLFLIDTAARACGGSVRNQIYNYLEVYLPCTKQTILMRAKKIRLQREEAKTDRILKQLKMAVDAIMPQTIANHEAECKRISDLRATVLPDSNGGGKSDQNFKNPKKRFPWNEQTRSMVCKIFAVRQQSFNVIKPRKETLDEFVDRYFRERVVKAWPDGWMKLEELHKEYEKRKTNGTKKPKENKIPIVGIGTSSDKLKNSSNVSAPVIVEVSSINNNNKINVLTPTTGKNGDIKTDLHMAVKESTLIDMNNVVPDISSKDTTEPSIITPIFGSNLTVTAISSSSNVSKSLPGAPNSVAITNMESLATKPSSIINPSGRPQCKATPLTVEALSAKLNNTTALTSKTTVSFATTNVPITITASKTAPPSPTSTPPPTSNTSGDHTSPPKRSTDHSINSIISSPVSLNHSATSIKSEGSPDADQTTTSITTKKVLNFDTLKSKVDTLLKTAAQAKPSATGTTHFTDFGDQMKSCATTPVVLQVANKVVKPPAQIVLPTSDHSNETNTKPATSLLTNKIVTDDEEVQIIDDFSESSSSDDVEFISESAVPRKASGASGRGKITSINRQKYLQSKSNTSTSRSNSPKLSANSSNRCSTAKSTKTGDGMGQASDFDVDAKPEPDLDVHKIMKALKEWQEMQTTVTDTSDNSPSSKKGSHHSASSYKLDQSDHTPKQQLNKSSTSS